VSAAHVLCMRHREGEQQVWEVNDITERDTFILCQSQSKVLSITSTTGE